MMIVVGEEVGEITRRLILNNTYYSFLVYKGGTSTMCDKNKYREVFQNDVVYIYRM